QQLRICHLRIEIHVERLNRARRQIATRTLRHRLNVGPPAQQLDHGTAIGLEGRPLAGAESARWRAESQCAAIQPEANAGASQVAQELLGFRHRVSMMLYSRLVGTM